MEWFEERPGRLERELALVGRAYPDTKERFVDGFLVLKLRVQGRKNVYLLKIVYPKDFPYDEPQAFVDEPEIEEVLHRWPDGSLCVEGDAKPPNLSGKIVLDWSIQWLKAYENWLDGERWPDQVMGSP